MISREELSVYLNELFPKIVEIRNKIHSNPEISFKEFQTSALVCSFLDELKIPYKKGIAGTGVLAWIAGKNPESKTMALRADIDALPIEEKTNLAQKSKVPGKMHACGHDVHTSILLGTASVLKKYSDKFEGTVLLVFQPGEEVLPGGAKMMLEDGLFADKKPDLILGQHVLPGMPAGTVGFREGLYMASGDEIYLTVKGKGGHAATPHLITNTVLAASHVLISLQQITEKFAPKEVPTVLSFGKVIANGATNIIPDEVYIEGTFRTMNEEWREKAHLLISEIASSSAATYGAECETKIIKGYPVLENHVEFTRQAMNFARDLTGHDKVLALDIRMGTEDFAYFTKEYPCVFYRLGTGMENGLHTPTFDIDESILGSGTEMMAWLTFSFLDTSLNHKL